MISLTSPVKTRAHGWPAGAKLAALCVATVALFFLRDLGAQAVCLALVAGLYLLPGAVFFRTGLARLWMLWPLIAIMALWHGITGDYQGGAVIILRLISAVTLANLVTMTTRLTDMIGVIRWLCTPLRRFGLSSRILEIAIALVIRMTPVLIDKGGRLSQSWRARSTRAPGWRIVLPFTVLALDDADYIADALRARGGVQGQETR